MNEANLFNALRSITADKHLSQIQVDSTQAILEACTANIIIDNRKIAYILATAFHESRLKPVEEIGRGTGHDYGKLINGHAYYGRGFVQLTWKSNYETFGRLLKIDLVGNPALALNIDYAASIIVIGMSKGLFTGAGLNKYFNDKIQDSINARKIVNGLDSAKLITGYYDHIFDSIK